MNSTDAGIKLTLQYRAKQVRIYELTSANAVLTLHISPPEHSAVSQDWHVQARLGTAPGPSLVDAWGATVIEALHEVGRAWAARAPSLTQFNWEAVVRELRAVRAV